MRVVHHHYSSGIDLQSDEEREIWGKRIREDKKERFFWGGGGLEVELKKKRNQKLSNNTQTLF